MKRSEVSLAEKFRVLSMAFDELDRRPDATWQTDIIGLACQFSVAPKLKREDFNEIMKMTVGEIVEVLTKNRKMKVVSKRKPYALMSLEELEVELQEVWDKGDNTDEEMDFLIRPLESLIKGIVSKLPKPKITDNDSWWTGRNRIKTFTSWQGAVAYWESNQLTQKDKDINNSILA